VARPASVAVLGTGTVGQTVADALLALGHTVTMGSRTADNPTAATWAARHTDAAAHATFAEAAVWSELVVNATSGAASLAALEAVGAPSLAGKVLLDISNPLDFSQGFPPSLSVCNTDSLGEQIQRRFPEARVVKALNTVTAAVMVEPTLLAAPSDLFVAGDDAAAKSTVVDLLVSFGWHRERVRDLGGITAARAMEMYLPLWLQLFGATGSPVFNIAVVPAHG